MKLLMRNESNRPDNPPSDLYNGKSSTTKAVSKWAAFSKARPLALMEGAVLTLSIRMLSPRNRLLGKEMWICFNCKRQNGHGFLG